MICGSVASRDYEMATTDDKYVCTLDAKTAEKAKKELNEDAKDRLNAVDALRTWIQQQPHITFNTGQSTILVSSQWFSCNMSDCGV